MHFVGFLHTEMELDTEVTNGGHNNITVRCAQGIVVEPGHCRRGRAKRIFGIFHWLVSSWSGNRSAPEFYHGTA